MIDSTAYSQIRSPSGLPIVDPGWFVFDEAGAERIAS
jgi:hypothetical protein